MLEGLRVIEFATYIAAPGAGGILADWGADVIKIEPVEGDPIRSFFTSLAASEENGNPVFELDNRGKRSIALNTATKEGRDVLCKLVEDADIFLTNVRPGGLERSKLDWPHLKEINPRLIYASVSGYGLEGADRDRPGFDIAAFWSRSGVARLTTPKHETPMPVRTAAGDHTTSLAMVGGILAAVHERTTTGRGRLVETSLLRTGIYSIASDMAIQLRFGRVASTRPREAAANPIGNFFQTSDGTWICLVPRMGNVDWPRLAKAVDRPELADDERFASSKARRMNAVELISILDHEFAKHDHDTMGAKLDAQDLVWAPVQNAAQVTEDPQAHAAGAFVDVPKPDQDGTFKSPAGPVRFHNEPEDGGGSADGPKGPAPELGQHTDEVLREAGFAEDDISRLKASKVI